MALVASCGSDKEAGGPPAAFVGGAAADEPHAALAAREVLVAGGNAADAAAAAYFVLAVTMPGAASLGGGGQCLVFDTRLNRVETIEFSAKRPLGGGSIAIPGNARGFFVLHGRFGKTRWEQIVARGESHARFGVPLSRAAVRALEASRDRIMASPELRAQFLRRDGALHGEGDNLVQPQLAATLAALRARDFFGSSRGDAFAAQARAVGASFTAEEFRESTPNTAAALTMTVDGLRYAFSPPPSQAGLYSAQLIGMLAPRWRSTDSTWRPELFVEATRRAAAERARWLGAERRGLEALIEHVEPRRLQAMLNDFRPGVGGTPANAPSAAFPLDPSVATIVTADKEGAAVACAVSAGPAFGAGRVADGVVLASVPDDAPSGQAALSALIVTRVGSASFFAPRANSAQVVFAGAAGGGLGAPAALVQVALATLVEQRPLDEAIERGRAVHLGAPNAVLAEDQAFRATATPSRELQRADAIGRVNAIACVDGVTGDPTKCRVRADRRGHGLAVGGVR
jgi:gamma-glutamyltranspeptidase/glutathione hydrolase